jgi:hypothetical protein
MQFSRFVNASPQEDPVHCFGAVEYDRTDQVSVNRLSGRP